jgi:hypothetical protein
MVVIACPVMVAGVTTGSCSSSHLSFFASYHFLQVSCPKRLVFLISSALPLFIQGQLINHLYYTGWGLLYFSSSWHNSCQMVHSQWAAATWGWFLHGTLSYTCSLSELFWKPWCWAVEIFLYLGEHYFAESLATDFSSLH